MLPNIQVGDLIYVRANCQASQKSLKYQCFAAIENDGVVASGHCECPVG